MVAGNQPEIRMPDDQNAPNVIYDVNERMKTRIGSKDYLRKMDGVTRKYKVSFGHPDMKLGLSSASFT